MPARQEDDRGELQRDRGGAQAVSETGVGGQVASADLASPRDHADQGGAAVVTASRRSLQQQS